MPMDMTAMKKYASVGFESMNHMPSSMQAMATGNMACAGSTAVSAMDATMPADTPTMRAFDFASVACQLDCRMANVHSSADAFSELPAGSRAVVSAIMTLMPMNVRAAWAICTLRSRSRGLPATARSDSREGRVVAPAGRAVAASWASTRPSAA